MEPIASSTSESDSVPTEVVSAPSEATSAHVDGSQLSETVVVDAIVAHAVGLSSEKVRISPINTGALLHACFPSFLHPLSFQEHYPFM